MANFEEIKEIVMQSHDRALEQLQKTKKVFAESRDALSDVVPGYEAEYMKFGDYCQDNFAVLFADMRNSTKRVEKIGAENTFILMHTYIPALLETVKQHRGKVLDIMGDGIMAFWGGKKSGIAKTIAVQDAGLCGVDMIRVIREIVNPLIKDDGILWPIDIGVGVTFGDVVVTKIGVRNIYDIKAYGDCINKASKYSDEVNRVRVSSKVKELWPEGKGGKINFSPIEGGGYYVLDNR